MKLLTFQLDSLAADRNFDGMIQLVAGHFRLRPPAAIEFDVLDRGFWRWNSIIIFQEGQRYVYCRGGGVGVRSTSPMWDSGVISEMDGP